MSRRDLVALAALLASIAGYYWPWLTLERAFFQVDVAFMDHPLRLHAAGMLRSGVLPTWTDALLTGFPLLAEGQAAVFYPGTWLYLVASPERALNVFVVGHAVILAAGAFCWLRSESSSPAAALCGSAVLAFSSYVLVEHVLMGFLSAVAWLPLLLHAAARAGGPGTTMRAATAPAALIALVHLAGDPLATLLSGCTFAAYVLGGTPWRADLGARMRLAAVPIALGTLLAAVQLVPTAEFLSESTRGTGAALTPEQLLPGDMLLTALLPSLFGGPLDWRGPSRPGWEESLFFFTGWAPLFLLPFGLTSRPRRTFWVVMLALGLLLPLRSALPVTGLLWELPPFSFFRWPTRFVLLAVLALAVFTARGFDVVREVQAMTARAFTACMTAALLTPAAAGMVLAQRDAIPGAARDDFAWLVGCWLLLSAATLGRRRGLLGRAGIGAAVVCTLVPGILRSPRPQGVDPAVYREVPDTAAFLKERFPPAGPRIHAASTWMQPAYPRDTESLRAGFGRLSANAHLRYGLRGIDAFDLQWTTTLRRNREHLFEPGPAMLDLAGVGAVVVPAEGTLDAAGFRECFSGSARVFCREAVPPRAFVAADHEVVPAARVNDAVRALTLGQVRERVVLERPPQWHALPSAASCAPGDVQLAVAEPGHVELTAGADAPSVLVLADTWYPGWEATVDGLPTEILVADGFLRGVALPAGCHRVVFRYVPRVVLAGLGLSSLGVIGLALLLRRR